MESFADGLKNWISEHFGLLQIGISALFITIYLRSRNREETESRFKLREADRDLKFSRGPEAIRAANTPLKKDPLQLTGIVIEGAAHEILGIPALSSEVDIQRAYKEKIKRYHPDRIGRPGSREWTEATQIAEALNRARNDMLERLKKRS